MTKSSRPPATASVVIPCYNGAEYLRAALDSVAAQTIQPLEVIVVDDGSTDNSVAVAREWNPSVRIVPQKNSGPSVARNRGIDEARGDWIAFLDADDLWKPEKLERQLAVIAPDVVAVHSYWYAFGAREFFYDFGASQGSSPTYTVEQFVRRKLPLNMSNIMVRRSLAARFPTWTSFAEDTLYFIELSRLGRIELICEPLTGTRFHHCSATARPGVQSLFYETFFRWLQMQGVGVNPDLARQLETEMRESCLELAWLAFWNRDWPSLRQHERVLTQFCSDHPQVQQLLAKHRYPNWVYHLKDRIEGVFRPGRDRGREQVEAPVAGNVNSSC